jgi:hypothetical protein
MREIKKRTSGNGISPIGLRDKRGAELTFTTIVVILVLVLLVVVIVLGPIDILRSIFGKKNVAPGEDLELKAQSCKIAASAGGSRDYCLDFDDIEIVGKKQYVNCDYLESQDLLDDGVNLDCTGLSTSKTLANFCINEDLDKDELVNGRACENIVTCRVLNGVEGTACTPDQKELDVYGLNDDMVCCGALKCEDLPGETKLFDEGTECGEEEAEDYRLAESVFEESSDGMVCCSA